MAWNTHLCICGLRAPSLFFVELGAEMSVASTTAPVFCSSPLAVSRSLTSARISPASLSCSSRWRKRRVLVSLGTASSQLLKPAKSRKSGHVVQRLFHRRVRQVESLLEEVDAQHDLRGKRLLAVPATLRLVGLHECDQVRPRHRPIHRPQEFPLALRLLEWDGIRLACFMGCPIQAQSWQAHLDGIRADLP